MIGSPMITLRLHSCLNSWHREHVRRSLPHSLERYVCTSSCAICGPHGVGHCSISTEGIWKRKMGGQKELWLCNDWWVILETECTANFYQWSSLAWWHVCQAFGSETKTLGLWNVRDSSPSNPVCLSILGEEGNSLWNCNRLHYPCRDVCHG